MLTYLYTYLIATAIFFIIDFIWLGYVAKTFYANQMGDLMADNIRFGIAALFYAFYTIGIIVFAIKPAMAGDNMLLALGYGALFGFLAYGTYDFTNMATIKNWPTLMSVVDLAWGTTITAVTATLTYIIVKKLNLSF